MESCFSEWDTFGVEPEMIDYSTMEVVNPGYPLRPEAIESAYYLFRLIGNEKYAAMGWEMFESIVRHTRTESDFAALESVVTMQKNRLHGELLHGGNVEIRLSAVRT